MEKQKVTRSKVDYEKVKNLVAKAQQISVDGDGQIQICGKPVDPAEIPGIVIEDLRNLGFLNHQRISGL